MNCPFCKVASMTRVVSGGREIDRCATCGALWFDFGEIPELTAGRLAVGAPDAAPDAAGHDARNTARLFAEASRTRCPRCSGRMVPVDFQATGIAVLSCRDCAGLAVPRGAGAAIEARFRFFRENGARFAALGESLAEAERKRLEAGMGAAPARAGGAWGGILLPVVLPLADDAPRPREFPVAAYGTAAILIVLHIVRQVAGVAPELPGGLPGLPPGAGFAGLPKAALLAAPFLHAGIVPLAIGALFLFVLGDNVEDRIGSVPFLALFLLGGAVAGSVHVLWGRPGEPAALGSAGAAAAVLGAYLVFFPDVSVRMYGMGRIVSIPAYLFGCAWVVAAFLLGRDALVDLVNPAPYSFAANLAGLGAGALSAVARRWIEDTAPRRS